MTTAGSRGIQPYWASVIETLECLGYGLIIAGQVIGGGAVGSNRSTSSVRVRQEKTTAAMVALNLELHLRSLDGLQPRRCGIRFSKS